MCPKNSSMIVAAFLGTAARTIVAGELVMIGSADAQSRNYRDRIPRSRGIFTRFLPRANDLQGWTALFLSTTLATSVTGFLFPFQKFTPAIGVGIVSMIALALAIPALYVFDLSGGGVTLTWSALWWPSTSMCLWESFQAFQKLPRFRVLAPKQSEPPFLFIQLAVLLLFLVFSLQSDFRVRLFDRPCSARLQKEIGGRQLSKTTIDAAGRQLGPRFY